MSMRPNIWQQQSNEHIKLIKKAHAEEIANLQAKVSEQEKELERLKETLDKRRKLYDIVVDASADVVRDNDRLREERKELVEALRARYEHLKWLKDVNTTPPSVIDEINFLQSLLSKFEVPNT